MVYIKEKRQIGIGYESLHIMELFSVQCVQVDDVIPILSPVVLVGMLIHCL